jgi:hypothetical protein
MSSLNIALNVWPGVVPDLVNANLRPRQPVPVRLIVQSRHHLDGRLRRGSRHRVNGRRGHVTDRAIVCQVVGALERLDGRFRSVAKVAIGCNSESGLDCQNSGLVS